MKRTAAFLYLLLALTMSFGKWLILIEFDMNRQFIAEQLCVNRAKQESGCKGRCQLKKALKTEETPAPSPAGLSKLKFPELLASPLTPAQQAPTLTREQPAYPEPGLPTYPSPLREIFHPPA